MSKFLRKRLSAADMVLEMQTLRAWALLLFSRGQKQERLEDAPFLPRQMALSVRFLLVVGCSVSLGPWTKWEAARGI